jgi:acyl carrier protein
MADRLALIIASYRYEDEGLKKLVAPAQDADALERVLKGPGNFQVQKLVNQPSRQVGAAIEEFFDDRKRDDLLLLYYSGHGIKDETGRLYFTTPDTRRRRLRFTSIPAASVNEIMMNSRSRSQLLLLDCCYSGAFAKGAVAKSGEGIGGGVGTVDQLGGQGRIVLTASDALQYAFEGDEVTGLGIRSVFTDALVKGLESGKADLDNDGRITINELYDFVHDQVTSRTPQQRPEKWEFGVQGTIIVARNPAAGATLAALPDWVAMALVSPDVSPRIVAVGELSKLLQANDRRMAEMAQSELKRLAQQDPDPMVRGAAAGALEYLAYTRESGRTAPASPVVERAKPKPQRKLRPSMALRLSPKPQTVDTDQEATWTLTITNDGDDLLRQVSLVRFKRKPGSPLVRFKSKLGSPFDLPAGGQKSFTFTTSYKSWGTETQMVAATGTASDGQQIQREVTGTLQVRQPGDVRAQFDQLGKLARATPAARIVPAADDVLARIQRVVSGILSVQPDQVTPQKSFTQDLEADELDLVEMVMAVEEEFDIMISDEEAMSLRTVGDMISMVKRLKR